MFYDQLTGKLSKPNEGAHKVVIAKRDRIYTKWVRNEETNRYEEMFVSRGTEILKELTTSAEGEAMWNSWSPVEQQEYLTHNYPHLLKEMAAAASAAAKLQTELKPAPKYTEMPRYR